MSRLMGQVRALSQGRARVAEPQSRAAQVRDRWWAAPALLLLTIALLSFSFAPFKQFYLAWFALAPWLIVLRRTRSAWTAFAWSWLAGAGFSLVNMWWLAYVTGPGMMALIVMLGLYWGAAGAIIRGARLFGPDPKTADGTAPWRPIRAVASLFLIAAVWVALEWLHGTWPLGGLPWLYLGHSQSPALVFCQIADATGVYGISFWVAMVNALLAMLILWRRDLRALVPAGVAAALVVAAVVVYGVFRLGQRPARPGPTVVVVQPNYPQSNTGQKGADLLTILAFHLNETRKALRVHPHTDLVVWSETMMPPLNPAAIEQLRGKSGTSLPQFAQEKIDELADTFHTSLLVGGMYWGDWKPISDSWQESDRRNSAYFFQPGFAPPRQRYDKIHLVPFGEYLPFQYTLPPLYRLFLWLSPYKEDYFLTAGPDEAMTVFVLKPGWRFVTPICFEDLEAPLVRRMFKPVDGSRKRADFIVNITNDGWFKYNQMPQHLQAAVFRSIENRVPTARSVNTGISGFIDSDGRTHDLIAPQTSGFGVSTLMLDDRVTLYTRFGDVFAVTCAIVTALVAAAGVAGWAKPRNKQGTTT